MEIIVNLSYAAARKLPTLLWNISKCSRPGLLQSSQRQPIVTLLFVAAVPSFPLFGTYNLKMTLDMKISALQRDYVCRPICLLVYMHRCTSKGLTWLNAAWHIVSVKSLSRGWFESLLWLVLNHLIFFSVSQKANVRPFSFTTVD